MDTVAGVVGFSIYLDENPAENVIAILNYISKYFQYEMAVDTNEILSLIYATNQGQLLSKRELECCYYLCLGFTIKEISAILSLSPRTIEDYLLKVKSKLGVSKRSEVICSVLKNRIVQVDKLTMLAKKLR